MNWDFSIYPEMTATQRGAITSVGLTLFSIQGCEHSLNFLLSWVFPADQNLSLETLATMASNEQKQTLGQLLSALRKRVNVHPEFDAMLTEFLALRNRFVHRLFTEPEFNLSNDESCSRAEDVMLQLQSLTWDIQNLVIGYNLLWLTSIPQLNELHEELVTESKHLQQVWTNLKPVFIPKP